ncbi:MAG: 30S ribosomal protein S8 [Candidatus Improbicoccus pseudotrichonymphae]|uniref:Small ribosomal subunit protein uS8 n=1 Tax=Candidatus Improbicoccus pseudotrichonymphae TaxID=3033792 RepID=A0AA48I0P5_9FIRM|nr:MAG: 30S ribosomal protein S8 [Candidatus Improbicoccus pseudotrichonymphae]
MQVTDSIADLLTRMRNAYRAKHLSVEIPASKMKREVIRVLLEEGYINRYVFLGDGKQGIIKIFLKYINGKIPALKSLKRVSKPGLRIYSKVKNLPVVMNGLGISILSTPRGVMTSRRAKEYCVGGEVLAYVW